MTDFSGRTIRVRELHDNVLNLVDNKVEKVIIKASSKEGFINGLFASIDVRDVDTYRSYQTPLILDSSQGVAYCYVKYGLEYTVSVQAYGNTQPRRQSFIADRSARDVEFYYDCTMAPLGTWIEATDGSLVSSGAWKTEGAGKTAQSVVLITADHQFRIGLQNAYSSTCAWGGYGTDVTGIANRTAWTSAITDFNAKENTDAIIAALNPNWKGEALTDGKTSGHIDASTVVYTGSSTTKGAPAAEACRLYSSGNIAAGKWDLPAFGQIYLMYLNKAAINACLTACGGTQLTSDYNWSSTEYSSYSAWFLFFAFGSQYSNYKSNSYYVRAVSASQLSCSGFVLSDNQRNELDTEFRLAYHTFIKGKKSSNSVAELIPNHEYKLINLVDSIIAGTYMPEPLRVFIVFKPTVREIFESVAIDRIVDTWISFRLEPLMDKIIPRNAPACRAGYGTKEANRQLREAFEQCSENYTKDCWIMKYDVQSYYMSIDKYRLLSMIHGLVDLYYEHWDKDILKWLIAVRLMTDPRKNVVRRSPIEYWKYLPPHKSLFNHPEWQGIPIGLLLTNESANIYLAPIDNYIINELGYRYYSRSIDDSWYMHQDKNKMLNDMALIRSKYAEFGLIVHPDKYYFQHYSKGVKILNVYQKPGRTYISNRSLTNCFKKIHWWNKQAADNVTFQIQNCEKFAATINSYLGMLKHLDEFSKRKEICDKVFSVWSKVMYPDRKNFYKMIVRKRYKTKARIKRRIRRKRRLIINYVKSIVMATKSQPVKSFGPTAKAIAREKINNNQWIGRANIQDYVETIGEGESKETRVVEGIKTWTEAIYDHEPTAAELTELANVTFE